jgi:hypothetical protein
MAYAIGDTRASAIAPAHDCFHDLVDPWRDESHGDKWIAGAAYTGRPPSMRSVAEASVDTSICGVSQVRVAGQEKQISNPLHATGP